MGTEESISNWWARMKLEEASQCGSHKLTAVIYQVLAMSQA